jgi:hypothetical protein
MLFVLSVLTGCRSLVVVLSLSKRKVVSSSPARTGRAKPKTFKIGSDYSFAKMHGTQKVESRVFRI